MTQPNVLIQIILVASILGTWSCKPTPSKESGDSTASSFVGLDNSVSVENFLQDIHTDRLAPRKNIKLLSSMFNAVVLLNANEFSCTGFMIQNKYIMTNQHCLYRMTAEEAVKGEKRVDSSKSSKYYTKSICGSLKVSHGMQRRSPALRSRFGANFQETTLVSRCESVVVANQALDLAIFRISPNKQLDDEITAGKIKPLKIGKNYVENEAVFLVGHPRGAPKVISYKNSGAFDQDRLCRGSKARFAPNLTPETVPNKYLASKYPYVFQHDCDTTGGSSGSPVIDYKNLTVVGLHWDGWMSSKYPHYDPKGKVDSWSDEGNEYPYKESNAATEMQYIREYMLNLSDIPADLKEVFK